jgi:large subunit ribosomal protein L6
MTTEAVDKTASKTSRVGKRPIPLPKGVSATISATKIEVKGPKGTLSRPLPDSVSVAQEGSELNVSSSAAGRDAPRLQGLARALIANMVKGVAEGYERRLEFHGTGYRAELKGKSLVCTLGFSHLKTLELPANMTADIPKDSKGQLVILNSPDKEAIGQAAATIRGFRPPLPYGGKGVRYQGERIREKAGKAGK